MTDGLGDAVALPPCGDGSRAARRGTSPRRRRSGPQRERSARRRWLLVLPVLLVVALVVGVGVVLRGDDDGEAPAARVEVTTPPAKRDPALFLGRDATGQLATVTLLVANPGGRGGDVVHVPPGTMVEAPSLGLVSLREAAAQSDTSVVASLSNVLGVQIPDAITVGPAELARAVERAAPIEVVVPERVRQQVGDRLETQFPAGVIELDPARAMELLAAPASADLDRLVRHQAFWTGWLDAIGRNPDAAPDDIVLGPVGRHVAALAAGEVRHHTLPVAALGAADDLYRIDTAALGVLLQRLLPLAPAYDDRVTVQVLNGTGTAGLAQAMVGPLVDAGARVSLTGNADRFGYATTQIVYYDDEGEPAARRLRDALGVGEIVRSRERIDVVDLTIVVGGDFPTPEPGSTATTEGAPS